MPSRRRSRNTGGSSRSLRFLPRRQEQLLPRRPLGECTPVKYHGSTDAAERMEIIAGSCAVRLDGQSSFEAFSAGAAFRRRDRARTRARRSRNGRSRRGAACQRDPGRPCPRTRR
ncbi:pyrimidine/purine nucleoside phosphorylase [Sorangium sp. So ce119]|uniref:pyrimidine/purine nucleoside phosphorylase n=1 Tax=Sorangium sp. So ce119 TaxID=3133279 RepID=UPI003F5E0FC9